MKLPCLALVYFSFLASRVLCFVLSPGKKRNNDLLLIEAVIDDEASVESSSSGSSCPMLKLVPSVPVLGSFFPPLTGVPSLNRTFPNRFNVLMNQKYGDFYRMVVPTFGKDIQPDLYVLTDPYEMQKIVQSQPNPNSEVAIVPKYEHPVGFVEQQWPLYEFLKRQSTNMAYIFTRGPDWWHARQALQAGLANPPRDSIVEGAILASQRLSDTLAINKDETSNNAWHALCSDDFVHQLHRAAFDMLEQVLFREPSLSLSVDNDGLSDTMFEATLQGMLQAQQLRRSPWQNLMRLVGLETKAMRTCYANLEQAASILQQRVTRLIETRKISEGSQIQNNDHRSYSSYVLRLMNSTISSHDLPFACLTLLLGGIDTTAGKLAWNILQLALNPSSQQSLYEEILNVCESETSMTTTITQAVLEKAQTPWLHGVVRETHRLTPALTVNVIKDALSNVTIHDQAFEPQTAFMFDSTSPQLSTRNVGDEVDPYKYDPTRWFRDAVRTRQGTNAQLLDHPYLAQPFGQGPRRCPGAVVASSEVHAFVAQFVLSFQVDVSCNDKKARSINYLDIPSQINTGPVPVFPDEMRIKHRNTKQQESASSYNYKAQTDREVSKRQRIPVNSQSKTNH